MFIKKVHMEAFLIRPPHGLNDKKMIEVAAFEERGLLTR
jgi:hypothetical protein